MNKEDYKTAYENVMIVNKMLEQENKQLKEENARLKEWKEDLLNENIALEHIRKEAIEYIKENCTNYYVDKPNYKGVELINIEELLEKLGDKENE